MRILLLASVGLASLGCALSAPYRTSGPSRSADGVTLAVAEQTCGPKPDVMYEDDEMYRFGLTLRVRVSNPTGNTLAFHRDRPLLKPPQGEPLAAVSWQSSAPVEVPPGESRTADVRFVSTRAIDCRGELELDPAASLTAAERAVALPPIRLVASR